MLNTVTYGSPTKKTPLLIAHGLFGSARNWGVIAKRLSDMREVRSVDMRNHGESPWHDTHRYPEMAEDLAAMIGTQSDVLGHSMGGKAAMMLALKRPDLVRKLVVADIAPVAYEHTQLPLIEVMRGLDMSAVSSRGDADQMLQASIEDAGTRAFLLQSLDLTGKRWRLNLDVLARDMEQIMGFPALFGTFPGPALFLSGAESDYVRSEHRDSIRALFPNAVFAKIPGAGHWLHAENPREFETAARVFLDFER